LRPSLSLSLLDDEQSPFNRPRTAGGLLLLGAAALLVLIDAFSVDYQPDTVIVALLLGTGSVLLGVEGIRRIVGGPE
jgi:hypothetical protein